MIMITFKLLSRMENWRFSLKPSICFIRRLWIAPSHRSYDAARQRCSCRALPLAFTKQLSQFRLLKFSLTIAKCIVNDRLNTEGSKGKSWKKYWSRILINVKRLHKHLFKKKENSVSFEQPLPLFEMSWVSVSKSPDRIENIKLNINV